MKTYIFIFSFLLAFQFSLKAQLSNYQFSASSQTYSSISSNATRIFPQGSLNSSGLQIPIGFTFRFNGQDYSQVIVAENGFLFFGNSNAFHNSDVPISTPFFNSGTFHGVAAAFGMQITEQVFSLNAEAFYKTSGTAPHRKFEVEWKNYTRVSALVMNDEDAINFKIILNESSNVIQFHYGNIQLAQSVVNADSVQVGLRGITPQDFKSLTQSWSNPQIASSSNRNIKLNSNLKPSSGTLYQFTPASTSGNLSINLNQNLNGQIFNSGQNVTIQFQSTQATQVKISLVNTITATSRIIQTAFQAQVGQNTFIWQTPSSLNVSQAKIRVESIQNPNVFDQSLQTFAVIRPNQVKVLSPNGNQQITSGQTIPITWAPTALTRLDIDYTLNGTEFFPIAKKVASSSGVFMWKVPQVIQNITTARIRISKANDPIIHDLSDNSFTIQANQQQFIEILTPNGGEVYTAGSIISIKFTNPQVQAPVKLWYKTRATGPWISGPTYTSSVQTPTISFVAPSVKSGKFMIKLENTLNPSIFDTCSNYMKIVLPRIAAPEFEIEPSKAQIAEVEKEIFDFQIFPNPASHEIQISGNLDIKEAYILNRSGVKEIAILKENKLNISHLQSGYYHLIIISESGNKRISKMFYKL